jgi:putative adenylate-forming enzyme
MNLGFIARVLRERGSLRRHERWSRAEIEARQCSALAALRRFALDRSPFYRRFHAGRETKPLAELPVLTKSQLMESFDELVTDRSVRLAAVREFLEGLDGYRLFQGRYHVARTAGSTGHPGIFLWDRAEWTTVVASYARAQEWAGVEADLLRRTRLAVVSSRTPWHQSALVGLSVDSPVVPVRRFDATTPIAELVAGLNAWRPENLICYASMARALAEEQLAGRLAIAPRAVMCSSEVLTIEARERVARAFGAQPFEVYAATETAGIASQCARHRLHLFEDLVVTEVVDEENRPVPAGVTGAKLLVTVLFSRTQPLIRYELSDRVRLSSDSCDCGRTFALVDAIEGRIEETLTLPGPDGRPLSIHPIVFHRVLEPLPLRRWEVVQRRDGLVVRIVEAEAPLAEAALARAVADEVAAAGAARPPVHVEVVPAIARTTAGKAPLVRKELQ